MRKKYTYCSKELEKQIVEYYFDNKTDKNLRTMASVFEINHTSIGKIISKALKQRRENSLSRRVARY
tara:strand:+ start:1391 stop:1591 length:201 start_codon:yes stop_codon:yes gene_type:complete